MRPGLHRLLRLPSASSRTSRPVRARAPRAASAVPAVFRDHDHGRFVRREVQIVEGRFLAGDRIPLNSIARRRGTSPASSPHGCSCSPESRPPRMAICGERSQFPARPPRRPRARRAARSPSLVSSVTSGKPFASSRIRGVSRSASITPGASDGSPARRDHGAALLRVRRRSSAWSPAASARRSAAPGSCAVTPILAIAPSSMKSKL